MALIFPKALVGGMALLALSGCEYLSAVSFEKDENSGDKRPFEARGHYVHEAAAMTFEAAAGLNTAYTTALRDHCAPHGPRTAGPLVVAAATFAADQILSAVASELAAEVDRLRARSDRTYRGRITLELDSLKLGAGPQCIVVERIANPGDGETPASALVIAVEPHGVGKSGPVALSFRPVYFELRRGYAVTGAGQGIDVTVRLDLRAGYRAKGGPALKDLRSESFRMAEVKPGEVRDSFGTGSGTGIVENVPDGAQTLQITVEIREQGSAIPDAERAKAEIEAARGTFGDALKTVIEDALSDI